MTTATTKQPISLDTIRTSVRDDLSAVDQLIIEQLSSRVPLIETITAHIIKSGGKRLRPLLVLLSARASGYQAGIEHHELAVIIEFVHTATLLHDDVVDESHLRRGQQTANDCWGNQASVLVGDFLYSRAFQMLTERGHTQIMQVLANTTNSIAEGEVLQLMNQHDPDISEAAYMDVIHHKTAHLFESAAEIGAILGSDNTHKRQALATYGLQLGLAFQIIDDLLDYQASAAQMGKNTGDDFTEGKATLPLIITLQKTTDAALKNTIREAIKNGGTQTQFDTVLAAMKQYGAFDICFDKAKQHIDQAKSALNTLTDSPYKNSLIQLADFALQRSY